MKNLLFSLVFLSLVVSCGQSKSSADVSSSDVTTKTISEIVQNETFLSLDINRIKAVGGEIPKLSSEEQATAKTAIHRFYSHVKTVDGLWEIDVNSGDQINMAEDLFQFFLADMNKTMESVKQLRSEGKKVSVPDITEATLASMLKL